METKQKISGHLDLGAGAPTGGTVESETDHLTDQGYWEGVWQAKDRRNWSDLKWVQGRYSWSVLDRLLRGRMRAEGAGHALEVGCGTGRWLIYFHKALGYSVTGCDYSETSCAMARRNLAAAGIKGTVLKGDLSNLSGQYDLVYSAGLIEHFTDPKSVLEKFASLLNPSHGVLFSTVPNLAGLSGLYHRVLKPETFDTHRVVTLEDLKGWYQEIGLKNIEVGALGSFVPSRFPRDKIRREHPRFYRLFWAAFLRPLTWLTNRLCLGLYRRFGVRIESPRFSPNLYAIGERG